MLDILKMRYFDAVARAGSFSLAARRLGVSQPTLSVQVARLEEEIGCELLQRHAGGVNTTNSGRRLLEHTAELFVHMHEIEESLRAIVEEPAGELRIGAVPSVSIFALADALALFIERYPKVRIRVRTEHCAHVMDMLGSDDIDLAVTAQSGKPEAPHSALLGDDPVVLVCGPGHAYWGRRYVRACDLAGQRLLALCGDSPTARLIDSMFEEQDLHMQTVLATPCIVTLTQMVKKNMGLAFLPSLAVRGELLRHAVHVVGFDRDRLHRGLWCSWSEGECFAARDAFISTLQRSLAVGTTGPSR